MILYHNSDVFRPERVLFRTETDELEAGSTLVGWGVNEGAGEASLRQRGVFTDRYALLEV